MAEAIFGLVGVLIGGLLTWGLERVERRSARRARQQEAARVLWGDVVILEAFATVAAADFKDDLPSELPPMSRTLASWDTYHSDLARLPWEVYSPILRSFSGFQACEQSGPSRDVEDFSLLIQRVDGSARPSIRCSERELAGSVFGDGSGATPRGFAEGAAARSRGAAAPAKAATGFPIVAAALAGLLVSVAAG